MRLLAGNGACLFSRPVGRGGVAPPGLRFVVRCRLGGVVSDGRRRRYRRNMKVLIHTRPHSMRLRGSRRQAAVALWKRARGGASDLPLKLMPSTVEYVNRCQEVPRIAYVRVFLFRMRLSL